MRGIISGGSILTFLGTVLMLASLGCKSLPARQPVSSANAALRNNAASLLYQLMDEEANLSKLLIIKRDREELKRVVKDISSRAKASHQALAQLATTDPTLDLKRVDLPPGERATRDAISKRKAGELLRASGADFEFKLLLTQVEALGYAEHLAKVAARNEPDQKRARTFVDVETQMRRSYEEVIALLKENREKSAH